MSECELADLTDKANQSIEAMMVNFLIPFATTRRHVLGVELRANECRRLCVCVCVCVFVCRKVVVMVCVRGIGRGTLRERFVLAPLLECAQMHALARACTTRTCGCAAPVAEAVTELLALHFVVLYAAGFLGFCPARRNLCAGAVRRCIRKAACWPLTRCVHGNPLRCTAGQPRAAATENARTRTRTHARVHTQTHTHTHARAHTHTHTHVPRRMASHLHARDTPPPPLSAPTGTPNTRQRVVPATAGMTLCSK